MTLTVIRSPRNDARATRRLVIWCTVTLGAVMLIADAAVVAFFKGIF
jgi:hypothetical protein